MKSSKVSPVKWPTKRLKYCATYNDDVLPESTDDFALIDYIEISDVSLTKGIERSTPMLFHEAPSRARRKVQRGDVLVSTVRTYLKAVASVDEAPENLIASTGFCVVRPRKDFDQHYLGWALKSEPFIEEVVSRSVGVSYPAINASQAVDINVPVPPLEAQKRIAAFLDEKTAQIDALIEKKQQLLERLAEKRQAIITQAVTKGLNPSAPMKDSGIDWLGQIPSHWEVKRLRFLVRLHSGATPTTGAIEYWDGDLNWISPKDMKRDSITETLDKVTELAVDEYGLTCFSETNVVIVVRGMILAKTVPVAIAPGRYTINQDMKALVTNGKMVPEYLQMYLSAIRSFLMTLIAEAGHGTKALRTDVLVDTPTLIPPISEQETIAMKVQQQKDDLDRLSDCVSKAVARLTEYRAALITTAVTGQIEELR